MKNDKDRTAATRKSRNSEETKQQQPGRAETQMKGGNKRVREREREREREKGEKRKNRKRERKKAPFSV